MNNASYLLIDESVLPEVYQKVVRVNQLLETGEASNTSEAVKLAGISRSVYYKYKNAVFPYTKKETGDGLLQGERQHPDDQPEHPGQGQGVRLGFRPQ